MCGAASGVMVKGGDKLWALAVMRWMLMVGCVPRGTITSSSVSLSTLNTADLPMATEVSRGARGPVNPADWPRATEVSLENPVRGRVTVEPGGPEVGVIEVTVGTGWT